MVTAEELEKFTIEVAGREKVVKRLLRFLVVCLASLLGLFIAQQMIPSVRTVAALLEKLKIFQCVLFLAFTATYFWQVYLFRGYARLSVLRYAISGDENIFFREIGSEMIMWRAGMIPTVIEYIPWAIEFDRLSLQPPKLVQEKFDELDKQPGNLIWAAFRERQSKHAN